MAGTLNTSTFIKIQNKFKERCITLFIEAYDSSISNKSILQDSDENDITAILHNFIDKNVKRIEWKISSTLEDPLFDEKTLPEKGFAAKFSRIDMRFSKFWQNGEYKYYVEAKNLKSKDSGLKRRYITTGINNFLIGGKYSNCDGFLVGYILEGTTQDCVDGVNNLLIKDGRTNEIIQNITNFLFESIHSNRNLNHYFLNYSNSL